MKLFTPITKVCFGLVMITVSILMVGELIGIIPNEDRGLLDGRKKFCESLAVQFSLAATRGEVDIIGATLDTIVKREEDVLSAAIYTSNGRILAKAGEHSRNWVDIPLDQSTSTHVQVPVFWGTHRWGTVQVAFAPLRSTGLPLGIGNSFAALVLFVTFIGFFVYLIFIKRTLKELDPRAVIPERVKSAFNALAEGLVIMDEKEQVILANNSFAEKVESTADGLMGHKISYLGWKLDEGLKGRERYPWAVTLADNECQSGVAMRYETQRNGIRTFMVNTRPIADDKGGVRGVIATFDDLTDLETRQVELRQTVSTLQKSRKELQDKTVELEFLATRDSLTGLLNRRAFFAKSELLFLEAEQNHTDIACIMVDIDHFKSVNDRYGHGVGDKMIQFVTNTIRTKARPDDLVCRYGGEEFCIMLPGASFAKAFPIAQRLRGEVKNSSQGRTNSSIRITASFGVASFTGDVANPAELINRADKALYIAKEQGRNRVIGWEDKYLSDNEEIAGYTAKDHEADDQFKAESDQGDQSVVESDDNETAPSQELCKLKEYIAELEEDLAYNQEALTQREGRDAVTGLPNRLLFYDRISQALTRGQRFDRIASIIVLDIDMFQRINDALGFVIGDQLLKKASERLVEILRDTDTVTLLDGSAELPTLSRTGADEFGILVTDLKDADTVTWIVKRILDSMSEPVEIDGHEIFITCSAGISLYPHDGDDPDTLLKNANAARYSAKKRLGRSNFAFYSADLNQASYKHLWFESQLHHALELNELSLHYQPKIDLISGKITSMEALVRWNNPKLGFVPPNEFIPVAEHTGLINEIGDWVIRSACRQAKEWVDAGFTDIGIAVNLSTIQFRQNDLYEKITTILATTGLDPRLLEVEITETAVMENFEGAVSTLNELSGAGVQLAIDDFGTGYSSLAYLKHLPINTLKIDRSFLSGTVPDQQDELIITAIIAMAHSMGLVVVAEGVETNAQKAFLSSLQCDEIQGYLFSKPLPPDAIPAILAQHNGNEAQDQIVKKSA